MSPPGLTERLRERPFSLQLPLIGTPVSLVELRTVSAEGDGLVMAKEPVGGDDPSDPPQPLSTPSRMNERNRLFVCIVVCRCLRVEPSPGFQGPPGIGRGAPLERISALRGVW